MEIVSGEHDDDLAQMTEFVQERMAGLGLRPGKYHHDDCLSGRA